MSLVGGSDCLGGRMSLFSHQRTSSMALTLDQLQEEIRATYGAKDSSRGLEGTFMWFMEEVGELASALRGGQKHDQPGEFADVLAWLATLANIAGIDLETAYR